MSDRFVCTQWSLLNEWWCVATDLSEAEQDEMLIGIRRRLGVRGCSLEQIRDRLFGGFPCGDGPGRRHVCLLSGRYTYTGNQQAANERRAEQWGELFALSGGNDFCGGGPFCEDAPEVEA